MVLVAYAVYEFRCTACLRDDYDGLSLLWVGEAQARVQFTACKVVVSPLRVFRVYLQEEQLLHYVVDPIFGNGKEATDLVVPLWDMNIYPYHSITSFLPNR